MVPRSRFTPYVVYSWWLSRIIRKEEDKVVGDRMTTECRRSVLWFPSERVGWMALRAILDAQPWVETVSEVHQATTCLAMAAEMQPDLLVVTSEPYGSTLVSLVEELRAACPAGKILVVGNLVGAAEHARLARARVDGYLLWTTLTDINFARILGMVLESDLAVASRPVVERLFSSPAEKQPTHPHTVELSRIEERVLHSLARGLTHRRIATDEHLGQATVERISVSLRHRFDAPNLFVLAVRTTEAGVLP
jgi:DNA-binding NarL/FixJ family response regulator